MSIAQIKAKIISNQRLNGNYGHLEFESGLIAKHAVAGQFVNIRVADALEPLLRRPMSIHGVKASKVKIIYEILGKGTQILLTRKPGEFLDIIGPLGNGFNYPRLAKSTQATNILIAGGMGVAPLIFLAEKLKLSKPLVLIGARTKKQILCLQEFKALGCTLKLATDDGSVGFKGRVTDLLRIVLEQTKPLGLFSCGPHPMLKTVAQIAHENKIPAQLSLEEHMACGIGACLGCEVLTKTGYKSVCKDGPVFSSEELIW
ncbi:MAG: dihydroorotate dehydrogenase electron transfer subunit [Candidatus Omnitrophota bacterium]|nr:dihydroorotate dehydrogenase electron transfer subunit [Candidatus Omnitrophota bacterium]